MKPLHANQFFWIFLLITISLLGFSQEKPDKVEIELVSGDTVVVKDVSEKEVIPELKKGTFTIGVGGRYKTELNKNFDEYSQYVLEQKDKNFFIRVTASYFVKDLNAVGIFTTYNDIKSNYDYITVLGDTVYNKTSGKNFVGGFLYKNHISLFGSERVYIISQAELGFRSGKKIDETMVANKIEGTSEKRIFSASVLLRFGILIFPIRNFSIEGSLAAVGFGYENQNYFLNGQPDGTAGDWFISFTPDFFTLQFKITSYF